MSLTPEGRDEANNLPLPSWGGREGEKPFPGIEPLLLLLPL